MDYHFELLICSLYIINIFLYSRYMIVIYAVLIDQASRNLNIMVFENGLIVFYSTSLSITRPSNIKVSSKGHSILFLSR